MHPVLRSHADARFGLFTTAEALSVGYRKSEIRDLCSNNRWVRLRRGILVTAQDLMDGEARGRRFAMECLAIQLSLDRPTALFSHGTAARLWGLPTPRRLDPTIRLTDATQWRTGHGWRMTCAPLSSADRWRSGLLRLTSAARTLTDCAREWPLEDAVVAMDAALLACRTTDHELRDAVTAINRWPGASRARRAAAFADGRAESPLETRGRLRIIGAGLPAPELQVEIRAAGQLVGVVDGWFEEEAVAVEFDGRVKYTTPWRGRTPEQVLWEEKRREDEMRALDIRVVRIADADLGDRWPLIEARIASLLASPGPSARRFIALPRTRGVHRVGESSPSQPWSRRPLART